MVLQKAEHLIDLPIAQTLCTLRYQLFAKADYVGREGRHHVLKLNIHFRHREWFEGLWDWAKSFDLPFRFVPANTSRIFLLEDPGSSDPE